MKSLVSPSYFKQQAKRLKKERSLTHAGSLDEYAKSCGFSNYRNYLNEWKAKKDLSHNVDGHHSKPAAKMPTGTPLGNFLRGSGIVPTPPHLAALADMFDKMTMEEQRQYLDEDARRMGLFRR